jgi:enoyl-CoA hydratase/carnithine racemase
MSTDGSVAGDGFRVRRTGRTTVFTLERPARLNALTRPIWDGLEACLDSLDGEPEPILVVTGSGERAFSAGSDLKEGASLSWAQRPAKNDRVRALLLRLHRSPVVSVAAINGLALGGGLELAMACAHRIAVPGAQLGLPEIRLAVIPSYGGTQFLPALVGRRRAAELMLTGSSLSAELAQSWGLVDRIADPNADLLEQACRYAEEFVGTSPLARAAIETCIAAAGGPVTGAGMDVEGEQVRVVLAGEDAKEGVQAFLDKRPPVFTGR